MSFFMSGGAFAERMKQFVPWKIKMSQSSKQRLNITACYAKIHILQIF